MTGGSERRDESVTFSLQELMKLEAERVDDERRAREQRARELDAARTAQELRAREEREAREQAAARAAEEARAREAREQASEEARREAMSRAVVEQARIAVEARARAEEAQRERAHELTLAQLRVASRPRFAPIVLSTLAGILVSAATLASVYVVTVKPGAERVAGERDVAIAERDGAEARARDSEARAREAVEARDVETARAAALAQKLDAAERALTHGGGPSVTSRPPKLHHGGKNSAPAPTPAKTPCLPQDPLCGEIGLP